MWTETERPQKEIIRQRAFNNIGYKQHSLWLPGEEFLCVDKALKLKVINKKSDLVFVERIESVAKRIKRYARSLKCKKPPFVHADELHNLTLPYNLDFVFLDFLGTIEKQVALWMIDELNHKLNPGANVFITHAFGWRYNKFMYDFSSNFRDKWPELYKQLRIDIGTPNVHRIIPICLIKSLLDKWDFTFRWSVKYQDSRRSMLFYRLDDFALKKEMDWPSLWDVIALEKEVIPMAMTATERSAAAKKAHKTRKTKKGKEAEKRHQAALKAWATRRKQA